MYSFIYLHNDFWYNSLGSTCTYHYLLIGMNVSQSAKSSMLNFQFASGSTTLHSKAITSFVQSDLRSMHTWWKTYLITFQMDLVWLQYHVNKASKSLRHVIVISVGSYVNIISLLFTLGILVQVGSYPKEMENTQRKLLNVLPLSHNLKRSARSSKPSQGST